MRVRRHQSWADVTQVTAGNGRAGDQTQQRAQNPMLTTHGNGMRTQLIRTKGPAHTACSRFIVIITDVATNKTAITISVASDSALLPGNRQALSGPPSERIHLKHSSHPVPPHPLPYVVLNRKNCLRPFCKEPSRAPSKAKQLMGTSTNNKTYAVGLKTERLPSQGASPLALVPLPRTAALARSPRPAADKPGLPRTRRGLPRS